MKPPMLSIVIPARNAERFITAAVQTALAPLAAGDIELIVIDHSSSDGTARAAIAGSRLPLRVVVAPAGGNAARAKNWGLMLANGEFVTFLDADDLMVAGSLDKRIAALREAPYAIAALGKIAGLIDANGNNFSDKNFIKWCMAAYTNARQSGHVTMQDVASGQVPGYFTLVYRRSMLRHVGFFDEELTCAEDFDFAYRCLHRAKIVFADVPSVHYRVHDKNTSVTIVDGRVVPRTETSEDHRKALRKHNLA